MAPLTLSAVVFMVSAFCGWGDTGEVESLFATRRNACWGRGWPRGVVWGYDMFGAIGDNVSDARVYRGGPGLDWMIQRWLWTLSLSR